MKLLWQFIALFLSFAFVFVWQLTPLSDYTIQIFGVLIVIFLLLSLRKKDMNPFSEGHDEPWSIAILAAVMLLLVFSTGGISSSLFFLLYFLVFGIAFVFAPSMVFVFAIGIFLVFLPNTLKDDVFGNLLRTGSIVFLSPLGYFLGKEYNEREKEDAVLDNLTTTTTQAVDAISQDVTDVIANEQNLSQEDVTKLNDILEKAEQLRNTTK